MCWTFISSGKSLFSRPLLLRLFSFVFFFILISLLIFLAYIFFLLISSSSFLSPLSLFLLLATVLFPTFSSF